MPLVCNASNSNDNGNAYGSNHTQQSFISQINRKNRPINLRDLFIAPPFDELDAVAMDGSGEPRRLTHSQLKTLRERG